MLMVRDPLVPAVATSRHIYDGKALRPGDPFECTQSELDDLRVLGFAQAAPSTTPRRCRTRGAYATEVLVAERSPSGSAPPLKRRYLRRDMQAEK